MVLRGGGLRLLPQSSVPTHYRSNHTPPSPKSPQQQQHNPSTNKNLQLRAINTPAGYNACSLSCSHPNVWLSVMNTLLRSLMTLSVCKHVSGSTFAVEFETHHLILKVVSLAVTALQTRFIWLCDFSRIRIAIASF